MEDGEREVGGAPALPSMLGATERGNHATRSRDFFFVGGRDDTLAMVGREVRGDWSAIGTHESPAAVQLSSKIAVSFLPLGSASEASAAEKFDRGFRDVVEQCQSELQREDEAPALALTLVYAEGPHLYVGHVGDSRAYLLRKGILSRLTQDQTFTPQPPDQPLVSDPALSRHLSSVVGGFSDDVEIETKKIELEPGDTLLLCSAGVTRILSDAELEDTLNESSGPLRGRAEAVLAAAGIAPSDTDRTVVLARFS